MNTESIMSALQWRAAVKTFDSNKKVDNAVLNTIIESARMAPTAYGLQPFHLVHVTDAALRTQLQGAAYGQAQVVEASDLLVVAVRTDIDAAFIHAYIERIAATRGVTVESLKQYEDMMVGDITSRSADGQFAWAGRQAYIALGMMLETAALLQVDMGPMEGFATDKANEILGLGSMHLNAVALVAIGYRGADAYSQMKKVRMSADEMLITK